MGERFEVTFIIGGYIDRETAEGLLEEIQPIKQWQDEFEQISDLYQVARNPDREYLCVELAGINWGKPEDFCKYCWDNDISYDYFNGPQASYPASISWYRAGDPVQEVDTLPVDLSAYKSGDPKTGMVAARLDEMMALLESEEGLREEIERMIKETLPRDVDEVPPKLEEFKMPCIEESVARADHNS